MQLAVDDHGFFHPIWADARTGTFQLQTATIKVISPGKNETDKAAAPSPAPDNIQSSLAKKVELVFDTTSYDPATGILDAPIRLRNISSVPIYGPITLQVTKFGGGMGDMYEELAPTILNATNQKQGKGAVFDYSPALGSDQILEPGALSGQIVWRLKLQDPLRIPDIHIATTGMLPRVK